MRPPIAVLVVAVVTSFAAVAAADIAPPEPACAYKLAGESCVLADGGMGVCTEVVISLQFQLRCIATTPDAGVDAGADAGPTAAPAPTSSGGCSMSHTGPLLGAFGIAMALPLLLRRRRSRS
jgi:hypothetical protein